MSSARHKSALRKAQSDAKHARLLLGTERSHNSVLKAIAERATAEAEELRLRLDTLLKWWLRRNSPPQLRTEASDAAI